MRDQVLLQPRDRVAEREVLPSRRPGRYFDGSSEVECAPGAVGDPLDQRRPEVAARALGGPAATPRSTARKSLPSTRSDAMPQPTPRAAKVVRLAAGDGLEGRDRPLVVDHVEDHRRAVHVGEGQRGVEVGLGGGAVADPGRRDPRVALDRRGHRPAHRLDELRGEVAARWRRSRRACTSTSPAAGGPSSGRARWTAAGRSSRPCDVVAREQQALLAVGREAHVAGLERQRVARWRSPPRPGTACRTRSSSAAARSACARRRCASSSSRAGRARSSCGSACGAQGPTARPSSSSTRTSA